LAACAAAVDAQLATFIEAQPGADLPRDIEHLRRQDGPANSAPGWLGRPPGTTIDPAWSARGASTSCSSGRASPSRDRGRRDRGLARGCRRRDARSRTRSPRCAGRHPTPRRRLAPGPRDVAESPADDRARRSRRGALPSRRRGLDASPGRWIAPDAG
jgi:hypothetical protein